MIVECVGDSLEKEKAHMRPRHSILAAAVKIYGARRQAGRQQLPGKTQPKSCVALVLFQDVLGRRTFTPAGGGKASNLLPHLRPRRFVTFLSLAAVL